MFAIADDRCRDPEVAPHRGAPMGRRKSLGPARSEFFVASDIPAISPIHAMSCFSVTRRWPSSRVLASSSPTTRARGLEATQRVPWDPIAAEKGGHKHFMLKEIFEQPTVARDTCSAGSSLDSGQIILEGISNIPEEMFRTLRPGTSSWPAARPGTPALVGEYLLEALARIPVEVEYASEFRYRNPIVGRTSSAIVITQSGETADTLAALREAKKKGAQGLVICNVVGSMATREADGTVYPHAGPEIGVASTKAFTVPAGRAAAARPRTWRRCAGRLTAGRRRSTSRSFCRCRRRSSGILRRQVARKVAEHFYNRTTSSSWVGHQLPVALEGALKLKEISYIHAEGYPAGEMKHGPIALIDERMPVVAIAPNDHVFEKMIGNVQEAKARGGSVIALTTEGDPRMAGVLDPQTDVIVPMPATTALLTPIVMTIPLQLLAYHIACAGDATWIARNLAKSVTVE